MKKLTALFLALALCLSLCTVTAFADGHDLKVWKDVACTQEATESVDYNWSGRKLTILQGGLTVSGSSIDNEYVVVDDSVNNLTIKGLTISQSADRTTRPLEFGTLGSTSTANTTLTLIGNNELTFERSNGSALRFLGQGTNTINGAGSLTASAGSSGIQSVGSFTFTQTGTVTTSGNYGITASNANITFSNGVGKILARGSKNAALGAVTLGDAVAMKGSTAFDAEEANINGETAIVGDTVKTSNQVAKSLLIESAKYTVTFDANGHGTAPASYTNVISGTTINKPTDPTAAGYTFGGWYKETGCTNAWDFATDTVTTDTTLYAKWTKSGSGRSGGSAVTTVVNMPLIRMGNRGDAVKELQTKLNALGYDCGAVDGIFGSKTYGAVVAFQQAMGIGVDGIVGPETWGKLGYICTTTVTTAPAAANSAVNLNISSNMPLITKGSSGDAVKALQTKLNALGYDCGAVDGIFGDKTLAAVKAYQTAKGLGVDGMVGSQTWGALR